LRIKKEGVLLNLLCRFNVVGKDPDADASSKNFHAHEQHVLIFFPSEDPFSALKDTVSDAHARPLLQARVDVDLFAAVDYDLQGADLFADDRRRVSRLQGDESYGAAGFYHAHEFLGVGKDRDENVSREQGKFNPLLPVFPWRTFTTDGRKASMLLRNSRYRKFMACDFTESASVLFHSYLSPNCRFFRIIDAGND
jgi:hypothetical protein